MMTDHVVRRWGCISGISGVKDGNFHDFHSGILDNSGEAAIILKDSLFTNFYHFQTGNE